MLRLLSEQRVPWRGGGGGSLLYTSQVSTAKHPDLNRSNKGLAKQGSSQPEPGCSFETQGAQLGRMFQAPPSYVETGR